MKSQFDTFEETFNYIYKSIIEKTEGIIQEYIATVLDDIYTKYIKDKYKELKEKEIKEYKKNGS